MKIPPIIALQNDPPVLHDMKAWRIRVLDGILRSIFAIWMLALVMGISNVVKDYRNNVEILSNALLIAVSVIVFYITATAVMAFITFSRGLRYELRAVLLLVVFYALGAIGLILSSFSGDGRIFLFAFVILSAVLLDMQYSLVSLGISFATLFVVGWMQISGIIFVPEKLQINSTDTGAWISGTIVFIILCLAAFGSIDYILRTLQNTLNEARESLAREQHASLILRTVSDINQLIVREQDQKKLLEEACDRLVAGRGYAVAWIALLDEDGVTLKLSASAGKLTNPEYINAHLACGETGFCCVKTAIQFRSHVFIKPSLAEVVCKDCPYIEKAQKGSAVALPLLRDSHVLGVLMVEHSLPAASFDDSEIQLLQELANNLAFALEKLEIDRQLQLHIRRETLVNEITRAALETPDLDSMLQTLADHLCEIISADACYIVLWDNQVQEFAPAAATGPLREIFLSVRLDNEEYNLAASLIKDGQLMIADDVQSDPRISPRLVQAFSIKSLLGLSINADGHRLGAVFLAFEKPHHFTSNEIALGELAVSHAALALTKAILYKETRLKAAELGKLYEAAQDMASSLLDTDALLHTLLHHTTDVLNATSGYISAVNLSLGSQRILAEYWSENAGTDERTPNLGDTYSLEDYPSFKDSLATGKVVVLHFDDQRASPVECQQFIAYGVKTIMFVPVILHGEVQGGIEIWESRSKRQFTEGEKNLVLGMASHAANIIQNARLFDSLRTSEERFRTLIEQASDGIFIIDSQRRYVDVNLSGCMMLGYTREEILSKTVDDLEIANPEESKRQTRELSSGKPLIVEKQLKCKDGSLLPVEISAKLLPGDYLQEIARNITERKQAQNALAEREAYFRTLIENSADGVAILDAQGNIRYIAPAEERLTGYSLEKTKGRSVFSNVHPDDLPGVMDVFTRGVASPGMVTTVQYRIKHKSGEWRFFEATGQNLLDDKYIAGIVLNYRDITERKRAEQDLHRRADELEVLAKASSALRTAQNVPEMLSIVTQQAVQVVRGTYGSLFLLDSESGELVMRGWYTVVEEKQEILSSLPEFRCRVSQGILGQVALSGEIQLTDNQQNDLLAQVMEAVNQSLCVECCGIALPLHTQNGIIGVLHIWMQEKHIFDDSDIRLLTALANMAGNAIHRAMLHDQALSHANELSQAYENTLAGWARALELRDEQTEGHTRRVTELTLRLAPMLGVSESDLVHVGRGALLHDIGKMGIPDSILHKPGPLTPQEKSVMERHPQYAYDMLAQIPFLHPALDIPYCHHEHWDGTGYPRRLKGDEIPLVARIFAVVDVWDALTSDRPYRKAWTEEKTTEYLKENAGTYFEPQIVEKFLGRVICSEKFQE